MTALNSAIAIAFVSVAVHGQSPQATTPQDCVRQGREFTTTRQQELRPLTAEKVRQIDEERSRLLLKCGESFDLEKTAADQLPALVEFYTEAQRADLAERAIARGLAATGVSAAARADLLVQAIRTGLRQRPKPDFTKLEQYSDTLDKLPDVLDQRITAHAAMNGYYRYDDVDAGIIKHSTWLIDTTRVAPGELRKKHGPSMLSAYVNLAEALAGQGENDKALDLLRRAPSEMADIPKAAERVAPALARYELVGKPAAPLTASVWLNRSDASTPIDFKGNVTLLQFTAHWCGPCKESYPGTTRLLKRFKDRGFQVVFYTRTYGYFESERNLSREAEIERDRSYFAHYGFTHPIAVGLPTAIVVDGKRVSREDPIEKAYVVGGIPQINVIDAQGNLRLIMIGYDDANEGKLAGFIETLLKKNSKP